MRRLINATIFLSMKNEYYAQKKYTLSIIIPAYNEEENIRAATKSVTDAVAMNESKIIDYEVLIFDDGSKDKTGEIADSLARENFKINVIHNQPNKGFGYNFKKGVEMAKMEYTVLVPGDNEIWSESIRNIFARIGDADIIAAYHTNLEVRPLVRRILSRLYDLSLNFLFGLNLLYYNGPNIIRTEMLKRYLPSTVGFAYMTEIMVKLLKWQKLSYIHIGMKVRPTRHTQIFKFKNIISVFTTIIRLFFRIHFRERA